MLFGDRSEAGEERARRAILTVSTRFRILRAGKPRRPKRELPPMVDLAGPDRSHGAPTSVDGAAGGLAELPERRLDALGVRSAEATWTRGTADAHPTHRWTRNPRARCLSIHHLRRGGQGGERRSGRLVTNPGRHR